MSDPLKIALNFIKFRPRTIFEIEKKLQSKNIDEKEIKKTVALLKRNELLDDKKFAKMWIADRNLLKPEGSYLLKMELRKLGVADEIIEKALKDQDEEKQAKLALSSKSRLKNADYKQKASFLQRRGFKMSVIFKILKES